MHHQDIARCTMQNLAGDAAEHGAREGARRREPVTIRSAPMSSATVTTPDAGGPPITQPAARRSRLTVSIARFRSLRTIARCSGFASGGPPGAGDGTLPGTASTRVREESSLSAIRRRGPMPPARRHSRRRQRPRCGRWREAPCRLSRPAAARGGQSPWAPRAIPSAAPPPRPASDGGVQILADVAVVEKRGEIAGADLLRRPPEGVKGCLSLSAASGHLGAQIDRLVTGQQLAAEDRPERPGRGTRAEAVCDVLGGGISLLGRNAAPSIGNVVPSPAA